MLIIYMKFMNEQTYENYIKKNQANLFHKKFDNAVQSLKKEFGK